MTRYEETSVVYHSPTWDMLVECGWITSEVNDLRGVREDGGQVRVAKMIREVR